MSDTHINVVVLTGVVTRDPVLRQKASKQVKAEFSFEVNRPFYRAGGDPVSDLFLVDAWQDTGRWTMSNVHIGDELIIVGTLNKESYSTRAGREHITIIKAKHISHVSSESGVHIHRDEIREDGWSRELVTELVDTIGQIIGTPEGEADFGSARVVDIS